MSCSVVSWNVNGLRACIKKGFLEWLADERPDILLLQEIKAEKSQLPGGAVAPEGYETWFFPARRKGYSGTALYSATAPEKVELGLGIPEFDEEGRTIVADYRDFVILGCYFPNSQAERARLPFKLSYDEAVLETCERLRSQGREVIVCGDFNAAHEEIDLANPAQNTDSPGFLPEERAWVSRMLELGYRDVFRERHPGEKGHYTWWSYRTRARARNVGWRLDYFLLTPGIAQRVADVRHLDQVQGSDHCPVRLELD